MKKMFIEEACTTIAEDIEAWLFERFENVRKQYFDDIVDYLLGEDHRFIEDEETLQNWLAGIGYTQKTFRKRIYQDNKEIINQAIISDAINNEAIKNMLDKTIQNKLAELKKIEGTLRLIKGGLK